MYFDGRYYAMLARAKRVVGFVATAGDTVVGFAIGWEVQQQADDAGAVVVRAGYLASFGVAGAHRRRGVGRQLVAAFIDFFFSPGYSLGCQFRQRQKRKSEGSQRSAAEQMAKDVSSDSEMEVAISHGHSLPSKVSQILLHCVAADVSLVRFYTDCVGFGVTGTEKNFYRFPAPQPTVDGRWLPCDAQYDAMVLALDRDV